MSIPAHVKAAYVMAHASPFWLQVAVQLSLMVMRARVEYHSGGAMNEVETTSTTLANLHQERIANPTRPQLVR